MSIRSQSFCPFYLNFGTSSRSFWSLAITPRPSGKREICQSHKGASNAGCRKRGLFEPGPGGSRFQPEKRHTCWCTRHESCKRVGVERRHRTHVPSEGQPSMHRYEFCCTPHVPRTMSKPIYTKVDSDPNPSKRVVTTRPKGQQLGVDGTYAEGTGGTRGGGQRSQRARDSLGVSTDDDGHR